MRASRSNCNNPTLVGINYATGNGLLTRGYGTIFIVLVALSIREYSSFRD